MKEKEPRCIPVTRAHDNRLISATPNRRARSLLKFVGSLFPDCSINSSSSHELEDRLKPHTQTSIDQREAELRENKDMAKIIPLHDTKPDPDDPIAS